MLRSTEIRWAAFLTLSLGATGCEEKGTGGASGSGGHGSGGSASSRGGGAPDPPSPTTGGAYVPPYTEQSCVDRTDLWWRVINRWVDPGELGTVATGGWPGPLETAGHGGSGQGGSGQGASGQGGSTTASGPGGAGGAIPDGCPSASDAAPFLPGVGEPPFGGEVTGGPYETTDDGCCYDLSYLATVSTGRPMRVEGWLTRAEVAQGTGWARRSIDRDAARLSPEARERLHTYWLSVARFEHASIASFAKFSLELMLLGAPAELLREAQRAGVDEVDHATATFAIAASYGVVSSKPLPMPELAHARPASDVVAIVRGAITEGCVAETIGAFEAGEQAALAEAEDLRVTLSTIADDEARHAALAWRFVRWAIDAGHVDEAMVREAFRDAIASQRAALAEGPKGSLQGDAIFERHGMLTPDRRVRLHGEVLARVEGLASELFGGASAS